MEASGVIISKSCTSVWGFGQWFRIISGRIRLQAEVFHNNILQVLLLPAPLLSPLVVLLFPHPPFLSKRLISLSKALRGRALLTRTGTLRSDQADLLLIIAAFPECGSSDIDSPFVEHSDSLHLNKVLSFPQSFKKFTFKTAKKTKFTGSSVINIPIKKQLLTH